MAGAAHRPALVCLLWPAVPPGVAVDEVLLAGVPHEGQRGAPTRTEAADGGLTVYVTARPGEPFEELYRRFKRGMEGSGILREYRRKRRFTPNHELRREKIRKAARTARKKAGRGDR